MGLPWDTTAGAAVAVAAPPCTALGRAPASEFFPTCGKRKGVDELTDMQQLGYKDRK